MPTIITRLYKDKATAQAVVDSLDEAEHHAWSADISSAKDSSNISKKLKAAGLGSKAVEAYSKHAKDKRALLIINAGFSPDGGTRRLIDAVDAHPALDIGSAEQNRYIGEDTTSGHGKIFTGTFFMTNPSRHLSSRRLFKSKLLTGGPSASVMKGRAHFSTKILPFKLLTAPKNKSSAMSRKMLVSSKIGFPMLSHNWPTRKIKTVI